MRKCDNKVSTKLPRVFAFNMWRQINQLRSTPRVDFSVAGFLYSGYGSYEVS